MLLKFCAESWYRLNTLYPLILATIQSKNQKRFKTTKQTSKYPTSNVDYRIFMKMSEISRFPDLFKKPKSEYLISETFFFLLFLALFCFSCQVQLLAQVSFQYIITGSGAMTIFFHKGLTRNLEIGNTSSEFCPLSGNWGGLGIPDFATEFFKIPRLQLLPFLSY